MKKLISLIVCAITVMLLMTSYVSANEEISLNETYIESGSKVTNTLTSNSDSHWYMFTTTEDDTDITIQLTNTSEPVRFSVYDSGKKRIDHEVSSFVSTKEAGTYYIEVYPYKWGNSYSSGSYDLTATYSGETSDLLKSGRTVSSSLSKSKDIDYYKITTTEDNGDVYIYVSNTTAPTRVAIYDSAKKQLDDNLTSSFMQLKAGTYYIEVYGYNWDNRYTSSTYDLTVTYSAASAVQHQSSTLEPNDTRENAYAMESGAPIKSSLESSFDRDFYSVTLNRKGNLNVQLDGITAPARVAIYNSKKERLDYLLTSYSRELAAGTYYIKVYPYSWDHKYLKGDYELKASYPSADSVKKDILLTLNSKTAKVDGKNTPLLVAPFIKDSRTLVPIRFVSEQLGANVKWDSADKKVDILLEGTSITLEIGGRYVTVNGRIQSIDVRPSIEEGTTLVPLRFVSEQLGREVQWNSNNSTITIK